VPFSIEVITGDYPRAAAEAIAGVLPETGSVVLTGGTTAEKIYPFLALHDRDWSAIGVAFSDERCVPPDDPASNYKMADDLLLRTRPTARVYRMPGEEEPSEGAALYSDAIAPLVDDGFDLLLLGMGADAHVGAMFPGSPALEERERLCRAVDRPDGMKGLTLTPPAMLSAKKVLLNVTGAGKAATVKRVIEGSETIESCPARLLAHHPDATFLLDEAAAAELS
jgi:6-phosphogluconolactonase